ncbi:hypothetical protein G5B47_04610 [Paenibacillus sp. 7124]|uniref:Uncharacterized protein n=1 Tax=Paenibacillus apii TaxID=1850370 RepID=A0A6M1PGW9_9BACL|nr:hypothetical protein [Paenibacillus apii]NGM81692.1 hypothetical protein [Paenibacillus apii]NJJ41527.1 hypothetical protein [Paenibacillus apii]
MEDESRLTDPKGSGVEPIPDPDSPQANREGSTGKVEDIVRGIMDNVEESLTGNRDSRAGGRDKA